MSAVPDDVRALADGLALAERHRGMGDYSEAYLGLRRDVEVFLAARQPEPDLRALEEAREKKHFTHGYLIAVANLINLHDQPTMANDLLKEIDATMADVKALDLTSYDLDAFNKLRSEPRAKWFFAADRQRSRVLAEKGGA